MKESFKIPLFSILFKLAACFLTNPLEKALRKSTKISYYNHENHLKAQLLSHVLLIGRRYAYLEDTFYQTQAIQNLMDLLNSNTSG